MKGKIRYGGKRPLCLPSMLLVVFVLCFCTHRLSAQGKVGNNVMTLHPDAVFELESTNKGFLLPRLALDSTKLPAPLSSFVKGMVVYNTAVIHDVSEGIYYSDGTQWLMFGQSGSGGWT